MLCLIVLYSWLQFRKASRHRVMERRKSAVTRMLQYNTVCHREALEQAWRKWQLSQQWFACCTIVHLLATPIQPFSHQSTAPSLFPHTNNKTTLLSLVQPAPAKCAHDMLKMVWAVLGSPDNTSAQSLIQIKHSETTS